MKKAMFYFTLILLSAISFLFSPKPLKQSCGTYVKINSYAGFIKNIDTDDFIKAAMHPYKLLTPYHVRQCRPLYIVLGTLVGYPINVLFNIFNINSIFNKNIYSNFSNEKINRNNQYIPFYIGFVFLNFIIIFVSIMLFDQILTIAGVNQFLICLLSIFLISNDVIKAYIWTVHNQMFSIFSPILIIFIMCHILFMDSLSNKKLTLINFTGGLLLLVYGNFIVFLPCILFSYLMKLKFNQEFKIYTFLKKAIFSSIIFFIPTGIWVIIVTLSAGFYYNNEIVKWRQLIWILDSLKVSFHSFIKQLLIYTNSFFKTILSQEISPFIIILIILIVIYLFFKQQIYSVTNFRINKKINPVHSIKHICFFTFLIYCIFFWLLGCYATRLTFTIVPPLLCLIALGLDVALKYKNIKLHIITIGLLIIGDVIWVITHIIKCGPFG